MKNKLIIFTSILICSISIAACSKSENNINSPAYEEKSAAVTNPKIEDISNLTPFTGEVVNKHILDNIPFMAVIENSRAARPHSGLSEADIVYETMAEGGITRFIALFHKNTPSEIGPIRSMRPYFVDISREYNIPFAHCGGSPESLRTIKNEALMTLNEFNYGSFYWRDNSRKAPHNLYTSAEKLRNLINTKGYNIDNMRRLQFDKDYWNNSQLASAAEVKLILNRSYNTNYTYKDGLYTKYMDNKLAEDRANNLPITVSNIVIQITGMRLKSDDTRLDIDLVGSGEGYVVSGGKYIKMTWKRDNISSQTELIDEHGKNLYLSPGKTFWHVVDKNCTIDFK
jgi:hypothetical protein